MIVEEVVAYVVKADGKQVQVVVLDTLLGDVLSSMGFVFDVNLSLYVKNASDQNEKAVIFEALRDLKVCFSGGREWCPSELFEYFRDINLVGGQFRKIVWTSPSCYKVTVE